MVSGSPEKCCKSYAWYVITLGKSTLNQRIRQIFVKMPFLGQYGPKFQSCYFKVKFGNLTNLDMQNSECRSVFVVPE